MTLLVVEIYIVLVLPQCHRMSTASKLQDTMMHAMHEKVKGLFGLFGTLPNK